VRQVWLVDVCFVEVAAGVGGEGAVRGRVVVREEVRLGRAGRGVVVRVGYGRYYGGLAKGLGKRCGSGREREGRRGKGTSVEVSFPPGGQRSTETPGWFGVCDAFARDQVA
jgi:hypothetical protein